jgi:hypothetical protein
MPVLQEECEDTVLEAFFLIPGLSLLAIRFLVLVPWKIPALGTPRGRGDFAG